MGSGQPVSLRQCALTSRLPGPIHIDDDPLRSCSVEQTTGRRERFARISILLKARAQSFRSGLIKGGKKTRKRRAMRQAVATKQGHKGVCPRRQSFVEREQGRLAPPHVAQHQSNKTAQLILPKPGAVKPDL